MTENLNEIRGKYYRLKAEVFYLIEKTPRYEERDSFNLMGTITTAEQNCLGRGIEKENPCFTYEKTAILLHAFKHYFPKSEEQRGRFVQWILVSSGYLPEEIEIIKEIIKRKEEGKLEKKVI